MCSKASETVHHLFQECDYIAQLKTLLRHNTNQRITDQVLTCHQDIADTQLHIAINFILWRERCRRIFKEEEKNPQCLAEEIQTEHALWSSQ